MTYQVIYSSESATPMQTEELDEILQQARVSNAACGITGALIYVDGVFLQILEGEASTVQTLMARIARDVRHETVTVLKEGSLASATFSDWKMAYISATPEQVAEWAGLGCANAAPAIPAILTDLRRDPHSTAQLAEGILSALRAAPTAQAKSGYLLGHPLLAGHHRQGSRPGGKDRGGVGRPVSVARVAGWTGG